MTTFEVLDKEPGSMEALKLRLRCQQMGLLHVKSSMSSNEALRTIMIERQKIRASIQRDVQAICTEACHFLGLDVTKPAMDLILDAFFHKMTCYADDLERFAKHAKRSTITIEDCRLLTRRNPALTAHINSLKLPASTTKDAAKRRRTVATTSALSSPAKRARAPETPARNTEAPEPTEPDIEDAAIDLTFD